MKNKKSVISLIIFISIIFSLVGGFTPVYATEPSELLNNDDFNAYAETEEPNDDIDEITSFTNDDIVEDIEDPTSFSYEEPDILAALDAVELFVERLYKFVFERDYDASGMQYWSAALKNRSFNGAGVAHYFFFSKEFTSFNYSDSVFVYRLYKALLGREPDDGGREYWENLLFTGVPRENVFSGFVNSIEFNNFCNNAGIVRGTYIPPPGSAIKVFVTRLYRTTLYRAPDTGGLNYWFNILHSGRGTGAAVAYHFLFSAEMINSNLTNEQFIERLYESMMGRSSDPGGKAFWVRRLDLGYPREDIFGSFVNSSEYNNICRNAGIIRGNYTPPPGGMARVFVMRLYREALLNDSPPLADLRHWQETLRTGRETGSSIVNTFLFGSEMNARNLNNEQFIDVLYNAMLGRNPYTAEKNSLLNELNRGTPRQSVFAQLANTTEFSRVCSNHGILQGRVLDQSKPMIALTYDDAPTVHMNYILDILQRYNAKATFYVNGFNISSERNAVLRAFNMGCEIGNHTWSHPYLTSLSVNEIRNEIVTMSNAVQSITGVVPATLRPGYGALNSNVTSVAAELGLPIILWTLAGERSGGWDVDPVANRVINNVKHGDIVLLHDGYPAIGPATERIISELSSRGFQFVTVSELLYYQNISLAPGQVYGAVY